MAKPTFMGLFANRVSGLPFFQSLFIRSSFSYHAPSAFLDSFAFHLINPRSCAIKTNTIRQTLTPEEVQGLNDETTLAAFAKGFFAGSVFYPEGVLLRLGVYKLFGGGSTGRYSKTFERFEFTLKKYRHQKVHIKPARVES